MPAVIAQKVSYLSALIFLALAKVRFVSIINLMAGEELQFERLQNRCAPKVLAEALRQLFVDRKTTTVRVAKAYKMAAELGAEGLPPSERAAEAVLDFLQHRTNSASEAA